MCRLITLPGVIGGWFKADVECGLPLDTSEPVIVRLLNWVGHGKASQLRWQTEQRLAAAQIQSLRNGRAVVSVRIQIPRHPDQVPMQSSPSFSGSTRWILEISRKTKGIDFFVALVNIPIFDTNEAPPEEQRPE